MAYRSTARNGTDTDIWVRDIAPHRRNRLVVTAGGSWSAMDFSPDGRACW
jgi:hypothetical protein